MNESPAWKNFVQSAQVHPPAVAIVLGSGLGDIAERIQVRQQVDFASIPGWPGASVDGHRGELLLGDWASRSVLLFCGRLHFYEGHDWDLVLAPIRLATSLRVKRLLLTNAAGGIRKDLVPGTLMAITDHCNLTAPSAGRTATMTQPSPYSPHLRSLLANAAEVLGFHLATGCYAAVLGPNYETPAEIRALRAMGIDAVGMSTAREIEAAHALGMECAAVSCITNRAAGLSDTRLTHEEVLANSQKQAKRLGDLIERFLFIGGE